MSTMNDLNTSASSKLALAIIQAEEVGEDSQSSGYSTVDGMQLPPKSPFQSPNDIEQELLSSLANLKRAEDKPRNTSATSHRDSKDSLLVTTLQRMDSGDLDDILGIEGKDNTAAKESNAKESKLKPARREVVSARKPKQAAEVKKERNPSLSKKLEEDKKKHSEEDMEDEEDQTVLTMRDMKEIFQKEHPGVEIPNDETLKQRYRKGKPSKHRYRKHKSRSRHSQSQHSRTSPSVHTKGSVSNILSQEKWGHASMDNITSVSKSSHHKKSRHGKSARHSRHSKSAPGRGHHSLTDHLQKKQDTAFHRTTVVDLMPPIPFDSQNSKEHTTIGDVKDDHDNDVDNSIHEFAGDSDEESIVDELAAPSIHVPITVDRMQGHSSPTVTTNKKALAHASPTATTFNETPLTAPHSWAGGDAPSSQSSSQQPQQYPMSAATPSNNKKKKTTYLKNKLRALLKGGGNDDSTNIVDYDDMIDKELTKGDNDDDDGPIPAIRRTLSLTKKTTNPPGKSRMGGVLSNVLGRNSIDPTKFGELDCPSSDDDDHLLVGTSEHKDVTVALESSTQGMCLDDHSHYDESTLTKEQELAKMQQEQEKVMRQVEEARIATRRIRKSHRRRRNSKSPSRLIGSDHVPTKSIRDPVKPTTSNSSVRSERSRSVESLSRMSNRKSKTTEAEILRKASHRSERRRARSIDASKHRKNDGRRRSRSIDGGKHRTSRDHIKSSEERQGRRRSRSFDAEALKNEGQQKDRTKRKATRKSHHNQNAAKPSTKRKNLSAGSIGSPYLTPASTLRRPSGDGDENTKDYAAIAVAESNNHHKITGGGGIQHRREATQTIRERQQKHHKDVPKKDSPPSPTEPSELKPVRRLLSIEPPPTANLATTATATGEPTHEFNMDEWVSDDSDEEGAFSVDAGHGL